MEKTFYKLPKDAYSYMNIVDIDLYRKGFHHTVGVSNFKSWTGAFSTYWYNPSRGDPHSSDSDDTTDSSIQLFIAWSIKVLCHEITHTFNFPHCIYFECLMNGSNTEQEGNRKPFYLCPVCLRKL